MKTDAIAGDVMVSFDHYSRTTNAGGVHEMHPNWITLALSKIDLIEDATWLNDEMFVHKVRVKRREILPNGHITDGPWFGWEDTIKSFYVITFENHKELVISNKTRDFLFDLMKKHGISTAETMDYEEN